MDLVHGPYCGPGPWTLLWTWPMDPIVDLAHGPYCGPGPWTNPRGPPLTFEDEFLPKV